MTTIKTLQDDVKQLFPVPREGALAYEQSAAALTNQVDEQLQKHPELQHLTGSTSLELRFDNHRNHAAFMGAVFRLNCFGLLAQVVPWVYRVYHNFGFSFDYFPVELRAWQEAVGEHLDPAHAESILAVYEWLLDHHEEMTELSKTSSLVIEKPAAAWADTADAFLAALLKGDQQEALQLAEKKVSSLDDLAAFYEHVVKWSLYEIGARWESGEISVAQEHLASAIVTRAMAGVYLKHPNRETRTHRVVVTAAPGEEHETGVWMLSDLLEAKGWNVDLLGANTPLHDILVHLRHTKAPFLALSVTMPFNVHHAADVIAAVKADPELAKVKVLIGGQVFNQNPELWKLTGADGVARRAADSVERLQQWVHEAKNA